MPENILFPPEGLTPQPAFSISSLRAAMDHGDVLEAVAQRCDPQQNLHFTLGPVTGILPRAEALSHWISGAEREISVISKVGKQICFTVTSLESDEKGAPVARLSRKIPQEHALDALLKLPPGAVVAARVTHLAPFGAFLDVGRGVVAMLPIEQISVARISHPKDRFQVGQKILAAVLSADQKKHRLTMTHKELLGTWMENASWFTPGETVRGIVRSVKEYGSFIELTPNLSGLADAREGLSPGDHVSVYVKSIRPERMKIKLQIIERLPPDPTPPPLRYKVTDGVLEHWVYSPPNYTGAPVETVFKGALP